MWRRCCVTVVVGWESDYHSDKVSQYTFYAATVLSQQKLLIIDNNELLVAKKMFDSFGVR